MFHFSSRTKKIINGIVKNKKLANSYLLSGSTGSFLGIAAEYLAVSANCLDFKDEPCLVCSNCSAFLKDNFVDLYKIADESSIKIENIRTIQETVKYGPSIGMFLFVIIHNAQNLTNQAANAFLKTLEEPPQNVVFVLLSNTPTELLPTIRSRCQILKIPPAGIEDIENLTNDLSAEDQEKIKINCKTNKELLPYFLENKELSELNNYMPYTEFTKLDHHSKLQKAQAWASNKPNLKLYLSLWIQEIWQKKNESPANIFHKLELIIENISQMKYNLNLRLSLENLFLKL